MLKDNLPWGNKLNKIDCSNHMMRNLTTHILDWVKSFKLDKKIYNTEWTNHFRSLVHKLIKEKSHDKDYF